MKNQYIDFDSCVIVRVEAPIFDGINIARLTNEDGVSVFEFPDSFTDEQIKVAVACANRFYRLGKVHGADDKAREIRTSLGLS